MELRRQDSVKSLIMGISGQQEIFDGIPCLVWIRHLTDFLHPFLLFSIHRVVFQYN
jgi:hypothetical protein